MTSNKNGSLVCLNRKINSIICLLLVLVLVLVLYAGTTFAQTNTEPELSFGRVMPHEPVAEIIRLDNPTGSILEVADIQTTVPLQAEVITPTILPGMQGSFNLVLGPEREYGPYQGAVTVNFKNPGYPAFRIAVKGFVIPPIEFQPFPAFFVATHRGKTTTQSVEILNHRDEPLFLKPVDSDNERYSLQLETLVEGQRYRLTLTLDGDSDPGEQRDEIVLDADPPLAEPLRVRVNTKVRDRVYHFPDSIDMGALPLAVARDPQALGPLSQILMVYRPDTDDFEVAASLDLDYIDMTVERGPKGDRYQMDLTLIPEKVKPGKIEGTVTIRTNDEEFHTLEVPVTGYILD